MTENVPTSSETRAATPGAAAQPAPAANPASVAGESARVVGRYTLYRELAAGGAATVYLGMLNASGGFRKVVAIKQLHASVARDEGALALFLDEARLASRIVHANVVPTLDVVADGSEHLLVMEYVHGETLAKAIAASGAIPIPIACAILNDVLRGLEAAHEATDENGARLGLIHRDVSPQNIIIGKDGVARLLDFGIARAEGRSHATRDGRVKGKLAYVAPEQLDGLDVGLQADVYAAGIVLWEALTGKRLYSGDTAAIVEARVAAGTAAPPSVENPEVPLALSRVVMRAIARDPAVRFATAREMADALGACGVAVASAREIAEWLRAVARNALEQREQTIREIEALARRRPVQGDTADAVESSSNAAGASGSSSSGATMGSASPARGSVSSAFPSPDNDEQKRSRHLGRRLASGVLAASILFGAVVVWSRVMRAPPPPSDMTSATANATALGASSTPTPTESTRIAAAARAPAAASTSPAAPAVASAPATGESNVAAPAARAGTHVEAKSPSRASRQTTSPTSKPAPASSARPPDGTAPTSKPAPASSARPPDGTARASSVDCAIPYVVDAEGRTHFRRECLL